MTSTTSDKRDLIHANLRSIEGARIIFRQILDKTAQGQEALAVIAADPNQALVMLNHGAHMLGMPDRTAADVLEEILGVIPERKRASEVMHRHLLPRRITELLVARGDLSAVAADAATAPELLLALVTELLDNAGVAREDMVSAPTSDAPSSDEGDDEVETSAPAPVEDEDDDPESMTFSDMEDTAAVAVESEHGGRLVADLGRIVAWAHKLKEHPEYQDWLALDFAGLTVRDRLLLALWERQSHSSDEVALVSDLADCGLDDHHTELQRLREALNLPDTQLTVGELRDFHAQLVQSMNPSTSASSSTTATSVAELL